MFGKYVKAFTAGFVAGAALALLFAPMSGRRLQRKITDLSEDVAEKAGDLKVAARRAVS